MVALVLLENNTFVYPNIEHKGGGYSSACIDECYEELKINREQRLLQKVITFFPKIHIWYINKRVRMLNYSGSYTF